MDKFDLNAIWEYMLVYFKELIPVIVPILVFTTSAKFAVYVGKNFQGLIEKLFEERKAPQRKKLLSDQPLSLEERQNQLARYLLRRQAWDEVKRKALKVSTSKHKRDYEIEIFEFIRRLQRTP